MSEATLEPLCDLSEEQVQTCPADPVESDADLAVAAALRFLKPGRPRAQESEFRAALQKVIDCGYVPALDEVEQAIGLKGNRILEVGCGRCWYAPFLLARGAVSFHGLDITLDYEEQHILDRAASTAHLAQDCTYQSMPFRIKQYIDSFENMEILNCDIVNAPWPHGSFDAAFMLTVTEHLLDPLSTFRKVYDLLRPGGKLYFTHGNYYCWNGHHVPPGFVRDHDPDNPAHHRVADWNHVAERIPMTFGTDFYLNFIRIHELMAMVKKLFRIDAWHFLESSEEAGRLRFSPEIRARFPEFYTEELLTDTVQCICTKPEDAPAAAEADATHAPQEHYTQIQLNWARQEQGHCHRTCVSAFSDLSNLVLFENDRPLGPADSLHDGIRTRGCGAYSLWGNYLYFSTSDNSDPMTNGRRYVLRDRRTLSV